MKEFESTTCEALMHPSADYTQPDPVARAVADMGRLGWKCVGVRKTDTRGAHGQTKYIVYLQREKR